MLPIVRYGLAALILVALAWLVIAQRQSQVAAFGAGHAAHSKTRSRQAITEASKGVGPAASLYRPPMACQGNEDIFEVRLSRLDASGCTKRSWCVSQCFEGGASFCVNACK